MEIQHMEYNREAWVHYLNFLQNEFDLFHSLNNALHKNVGKKCIVFVCLLVYT